MVAEEVAGAEAAVVREEAFVEGEGPLVLVPPSLPQLPRLPREPRPVITGLPQGRHVVAVSRIVQEAEFAVLVEVVAAVVVVGERVGVEVAEEEVVVEGEVAEEEGVAQSATCISQL